KPLDGIFVPPLTPHQFVANKGSILKILCIVDARRDRPQRLSDEELKDLLKNPEIAGVIKP
ncbi:MAG: cupin domain-containing protein, partial [candidate division WOR-3 bacterium]